jgi:hypothetical protein
MKAEYDFSKGRRGQAVPTKGKTRITIYIDDQIVAAFATSWRKCVDSTDLPRRHRALTFRFVIVANASAGARGCCAFCGHARVIHSTQTALGKSGPTAR